MRKFIKLLTIILITVSLISPAYAEESSNRTAYFYIWKPGTAMSTNYREAWYFAGTGTVNMPTPTGSANMDYDLSKVVAYPDSMPDISWNGHTYYYNGDGANSDKQYTYTMNWSYIIDSSGANNGDSIITQENVYHVDGYALLSDKLTIDFKVMTPGSASFVSIDGYPKLYEENSNISSPSVDNSNYCFDGWYLDASLSQKATSSDFIANSNKVFYGKYKEKVNVRYWSDTRNEYTNLTQTVIKGETITAHSGSDLSHDLAKSFLGWTLDYSALGIHNVEGVIDSKKLYDSVMASGRLINGSYGPVNSNTNLYAVWAKRTLLSPLSLTYSWNLPSGQYYNDNGELLTIKLPTDSKTYYSGDTYVVDSSYPADTTVYTLDTYGNRVGEYVFGGWKDTNNGVFGDKSIIIEGNWDYSPLELNNYHITYQYVGDYPTNAPAVPIDTNDYVNGQGYVIDTNVVDDIKLYDDYDNLVGTWSFTGWNKENGVINNSDVIVSGSWTYTPATVAKYTVIYIDNFNSFDTETHSDIVKNAPTPIYSKGTPTRIGYTFVKWSPDVAEKVVNDATYYAEWRANTDTKYIVQHLFKELNTETEYIENVSMREELAGTTDTLTQAKAKEVKGFTPLSFEQKKIAPDGSTTIKIKYDRNVHQVIINYVDPDNNPIKDSTIIDVAYGDNYYHEIEDIEGFELPEGNLKVVEGTMNDEDVVVNITFNPIIIEEETKPIPAPIPTPKPTTSPAPTPTTRPSSGGSNYTYKPMVLPNNEPTATPEIILEEDDTTGIGMLEENETSTVAPVSGWALVNLICTLGTLIPLVVLLFAKKEKEEDETDKNINFSDEEVITVPYKRKKKYLVLNLIVSVFAIVIFALTENIFTSMRLVDRWTLLMVVLLFISLIIWYLGMRWNKDDNK